MKRYLIGEVVLCVALGALVACGSPPAPSEPPPASKPSSTPTVTTSVSPGVELAEVAAVGYEPADTVPPAVSVSLTEITLNGKPVVTLRDGVVAAADLEGGALGMKITKLAARGGELAPSASPATPVTLSIDRRVPYGTVLQVMYSLQQSGTPRFALLARAGARVVAVPLALPEKVPATATPSSDKPSPTAPGGPVRMMVSVTDKTLVAWSMSQLEGTLGKPKIALDRSSPTAMTDLANALAEIAGRRWPSDQRHALDRQITLQLDRAMRVQLLAELAGGVRATPEGKPLFPEVLLASGFQ